MHSVSIVGCGYTGLRVAQRWLQAKRFVHGYGNRPETLKAIQDIGAAALPVNLDGPLAEFDFAEQLVYYTVPPAPHGERDSRLERLLDHIVGYPARFVYLSTTGVYGNRDGGRVDEDTPPAPTTERAMRRLAAETALRAWADSHAVSWCILRVPGIYGPGRLPLERLRRREPAIVPSEATPSNRIHVEDLVTACIAAGTSARADGRIYNVTDGSEESLTGYLQRVARLGHLPSPPLIARSEAQKTASAMSWSFLSESRRVDNRRMLEELGIALAYRDLDQGIRASLKP
jgi:nucleoside-diphosphate-sugar epimerase